MVNTQQAFERLEVARTPEEEASVFETIWNKADEFGFSAYDANGEILPVSIHSFPSQLYAINLQINGETFYHILIKPENIYILIRE